MLYFVILWCYVNAITHQPAILFILPCFFSTVSHSYGYGLLDAGAMVALAQNWTTVGPQRQCVHTMLAEPRFSSLNPFL